MGLLPALLEDVSLNTHQEIAPLQKCLLDGECMLVIRRVLKPCECLSDGANLNVRNFFCFQGSDWLVQAVPTKPLPSW